jgi:hypothetical protein
MNFSPHPFWASFSFWIRHQIRGWVKPTTVYLAMGAITYLSHSKADLLVENALLRQHLAERIGGELFKLGINLSKRTIQKYICLVRKTPSFSQNWATFLKNHTGSIWACDFTVVYDWLFQPLYIFVIMELKNRRIIHIGVTDSPTDE